ncbi:MAG: SIMPL domain-containing protein [Methylococcaceae bacterium]|jgi:predicted secreted protein
MRRGIRLLYIGLLVVLPLEPSFPGESNQAYDRINLTASLESKASQDTLIAILYARSTGANAESLAHEVNGALKSALETLKKVPDVDYQTLNYQTQPTYQDQKVTGWSVQQSLRLESKNLDALAGVIGLLQKTLKVESIDYMVSAEKLREAEDHLIADTLKGFASRADLVSKQLGRKRYRIVTLNVNTHSNNHQPLRANRAMSLEGSDAATSPVLLAGEQIVSVTVEGTIELQAD